MAALGPWPRDRPVAVAVSGGPDSLALAFLLARWSPPHRPPVALVVDHGLRAGSDRDATLAARELLRIGCRVRRLAIDGLAPGPALQERARDARHARLASACAVEGLLDLLLAHHRDDQAETLALRRAAGSGPDGLAGMSPLDERDGVRLVRPLLGIGRDRLRATADAAGIAFVDDPANRDPRFARARLRAGPPLPTPTPEAGNARRIRARALAATAARCLGVHEAGFVTVDAPSLPFALLGAAIRTVSGSAARPRTAALRALAGRLRPATLGGAALLARSVGAGGGFLLVREAAAMPGPVPATPGARWDRHRVATGRAFPAGWSLGPLGDASASFRAATDWPAALLRTLPAFRDGRGAVRAVPHLGWTDGRDDGDDFSVTFSPRSPLVPSFFMFKRQTGVTTAARSLHDEGSEIRVLGSIC